eukprot:gb/GECG01000345.1/.p1 GENE.gb/GECG01000345.1/~~gb/GECG01000345.1/.p1  ORF type:complete len:101 (+),score=3.68 gb/GECG01000345.1/:1-303(+)
MSILSMAMGPSSQRFDVHFAFSPAYTPSDLGGAANDTGHMECTFETLGDYMSQEDTIRIWFHFGRQLYLLRTDNSDFATDWGRIKGGNDDTLCRSRSLRE